MYYLNLNEILLFFTTFIEAQSPTALLNSEIKKAKKYPDGQKKERMTTGATDDTGLEPVTSVLETNILPVKLIAYKTAPKRRKEWLRATGRVGLEPTTQGSSIPCSTN